MFPTKNLGRLAVFTITFLVLSSIGVNSASTGVPIEGESTYVLNGRPAKLGEFPYVVAFRQLDEEGDTVSVCGGTILDASHIITAAHCLFEVDEENHVYLGDNPSLLTITAGTLDYFDQDGSGQSIKAKEVCVHSSYTPGKASKGFDIAIIKLTEPLNLSKPNLVRKANILWTPTEAHGKRGTIAGWGYTLNEAGNDTTYLSRYLQTAEVFVYTPQEQCTFYGGDISTIMCAGTAKEDIPNVPDGGKPTGTCGGDSGSPLGCSFGAKKYESCGLVSYTKDKCKDVNTLGKRTVFTKYASYQAWVEEYVTRIKRKCF